ncbi:MAG: response regulator [Solirubrobacteraceae bacterium]|nr:response regulator [Patulibacter sp.]
MSTSSVPAVFGLVEDSDEDFAAFSRVVDRDAPGALLTRWRRAEEALASLAEGGAPADAWPSILVVDLNLPGIDGCELVRRLRAAPATRTLPVFVLSGSSRQADIDRCYAAGANAYLTKPASAAELRSLLQLLFRSLAVFRAPTPLAAGPVEVEQVEEASLEEARAEYERQLRDDRDAERRARERAEALQRIATRLAGLSDVAQVESAFVGELVGGGVVDRAELVRKSSGEPLDPFFSPQLMGDGTTGVVPVLTPAGSALAELRIEADSYFGEAEQAFLIEAAGLAGQALERVARSAATARRAARSGTDLPAERWWKQAIDAELRQAARTRQPFCVVVIELDGFDRISIDQGAIAADRLLLSVSDAWRRAGHDLLSRHGGEEFAALLPGVAYRQARLLIADVRRVPSLAAAFSTGIAEWDGREDAGRLVARAEAALVEERRLRSRT